MAGNVVFHRDGTVSVDGAIVGHFQGPDPSGAAWASTRLWVFRSLGGKAGTARTRFGLSDHARAAGRRLYDTSA